MPSLREWRHIIAHGASVGLSHPDVGHRLEVVPFSSKVLPDQLPCGLVQQGASGIYTDSTDEGDLSTACQVTAAFTLWLVVGDPLTESAADLMDDLVSQVHRGALAACADDPLNPDGFVPTVEGVDQPSMGQFAGRDVWWAPVSLLVPARP